MNIELCAYVLSWLAYFAPGYGFLYDEYKATNICPVPVEFKTTEWMRQVGCRGATSCQVQNRGFYDPKHSPENGLVYFHVGIHHKKKEQLDTETLSYIFHEFGHVAQDRVGTLNLRTCTGKNEAEEEMKLLQLKYLEMHGNWHLPRLGFIEVCHENIP